MFYVFLYFMILILYSVFNNKSISIGKNKKIRLNIYLIIAIVLTIVSSFRSDNVGIDTKSYSEIFKLINSGLNIKYIHDAYATTIEIGFLYFSKLVISLFNNRVLYFAVQYLIMYYLTLKYITKKSSNRIISLAMYIALFYTGTMNVMRQSLAIALLLNSLLLMEEKKYIKTVAFFICALLVHYSSILFIPVYFLQFVKKRKYIYWIEIITAVVGLIIYYSPLTNTVLQLLNYERYINSYHMVKTMSNGTMILVYIIIVVIANFLSIRNNAKINNEYYYYMTLSTIGTMLGIISLGNELYLRVAGLYMIFQTILFSKIINVMFEKRTKNIAIFVIIIMLGIATYINGLGYSYEIYKMN